MRIRSLGFMGIVWGFASCCGAAHSGERAIQKSAHASVSNRAGTEEPDGRKGWRSICVSQQGSPDLPTSPLEADKLERKLKQRPSDFVSRRRLMEYYFWQMMKNPASHEPHERHVLWIIQNQPAEDIAGWPVMALIAGREDAAAQKAQRLWKQQVSAHPRNIRIIGNAATFFVQQQSDYGPELLNQAQTQEPKNPKWPIALATACKQAMEDSTGKKRQVAAEKALAAYERWSLLTGDDSPDTIVAPLALVAFEAGNMDKARLYATKLVDLAGGVDKQKYGDAIHRGNIILGRAALRSGDREKAKSYLSASAHTPGSPVLEAFGPNMMLARELLEKGERQAVLDFFVLCAKFWKSEKLEQWTAEVKAGKVPGFGNNLDL